MALFLAFKTRSVHGLEEPFDWHASFAKVHAAAQTDTRSRNSAGLHLCGEEQSMDETGMSDAQYGDMLRGLINDLERIKRLGVSDDALVEIDLMIARFEAYLGRR